MPSVVLDTNVVMDWLVFRDASARPVADAIESGRVAWLASAELRAELAHVLGRGVAAAWHPDAAVILGAVDRHAAMRAQPAPIATGRLRCDDADDQKFIDFALTHGATWLVSRDRAVLKLAKKALPLGLTIVTPARWSPP